MIKCDYFKKSINKCKCKLSNSTITLLDCIKCTKFKQTSVSSINITPRSKSVLKCVKTPLNKISKKRIKLEKERYSILTNDLTHCYICGKKKNDIHEILSGSKRIISIKNGFCIPICRLCHNNIQNDNEKMIILKRKCQTTYEQNNTREKWLKIVGKNYLT